jgi:hypothetical protein
MNQDLIQTGDILHCRGKRLISRLIMRFTKSNWSHTALAIRIEGKLFIVDAQRDGLNLRPFEAWQAKYDYNILVCRTMKANWNYSKSYIKERAMGKIGVTAYDFESLFIRYPWKLLTGKWKNRGSKEDDRMYCSEFVAWSYSVPNWFEMSPKLVYEWCVQNGFQVIQKNF